MKTALVAALAVSGVLLAGCATSVTRGPAADPGTTPTPNATSSQAGPADDPAGDQAEAVALIHRMIDLIPLPPGSVAQPASSAGSPAMGTPGAEDLVDLTTVWQVPLPYSDVQSWATAHMPAGYTLEGSEHGGGPTTTDSSDGIQFTAPTDPAAPDNQAGSLTVSAHPIADDPTSSIWQVDATDVWYDPTPVPDRHSGERIHVDIADGCPASLDAYGDVSNSVSGLDDALLPAGDPTSALVCQYTGMNGPPTDQPTSSRTLTADQAADLAKQVRALRVGGSGETFHSCPMEDNQRDVIVFAMPQGDVDLWWQLQGCGWVDNGTIIAQEATLTLP